MKSSHPLIIKRVSLAQIATSNSLTKRKDL